MAMDTALQTAKENVVWKIVKNTVMNSNQHVLTVKCAINFASIPRHAPG